MSGVAMELVDDLTWRIVGVLDILSAAPAHEARGFLEKLKSAQLEEELEIEQTLDPSTGDTCLFVRPGPKTIGAITWLVKRARRREDDTE